MLQNLSLNPLVFVVKNFFKTDECDALIKQAEDVGFSDAPVTVAQGVHVMLKDVRDNTRVIVDNPSFLAEFEDALQNIVPPSYKEYKYLGVNSRFRFYKYTDGQTFKTHMDGSYKPNADTKSIYTALIYLSDDFNGGGTSFYNEDGSLRFTVNAEKGTLLVFKHNQLHSGDPVLDGVKYVVRTDLMYTNKGV